MAHDPVYAGSPYKQGLRTARVYRLDRKETIVAAGRLRHADPLASAAIGITRAQKVTLLGFVILLGGLACFSPRGAAIAVHHFLWLFFATSITFRAFMLVVSPRPVNASVVLPVPDLPVYTILIPLYRETEVLGALCEAIGALNYPRSKLDVKLLLEADDKKTIRAARDRGLGPEWEIIIIPPLGPRTKPKALNAGLARARGQLVTIYDAEDRPHSEQLLHAAHAFSKDRGGHLGCVQAPLGYYNANQNWLTRQFTLEYAAHFQVLVPAMARLGLPFPLGGTSNHFRMRALRHVGAWDPYNVTEDADLGYRLSAKGWHLDAITPPTYEEAVSKAGPWQRQRSRWLKGYLQTMGVHMRRPATHNALAGMLSMTATLGTAVFAALGHASFFVLTLASLLLAPWLGSILSPIDYGLALAGLLVGTMMLGIGAKRAGFAFSLWDLSGAVLYWPLQSWAMAKAISDLITRPFHWEKTNHGFCSPPEVNT